MPDAYWGDLRWIAKNLNSSLSRSSLRLGRYEDLAAMLGYDAASDPLFKLMHEEVGVTAAYADWQATHMERVTARRRDPDQSHDEQAVAAVLAARWQMVDHPHVRLGAMPQWRLTGCLLDAKSEHYLITITQERIGGMSRRLGRGETGSTT